VRTLIVVGGGVIGLFTAYYAAERGFRVTIVERGGPDHDSCSLGNAGMIVPSHFVPLAAPGMVGLGLRMLPNPEGAFGIRPRLDPELAGWCWQFARACSQPRAERAAPLLRDLSVASRRCYEELAERSGLEFGLVRRGLMMLCKKETTLRAEADLAEQACRLGIRAEVLTPEKVGQLEPAMRMAVAGAVYFPDDCHLSPSRLIEGLTRALQERGVQFAWNTDVTGGTVRGDRVKAISTSGGTLSADEIVIASGAWSSRLLRSLGVRLPLLAGKGYSLTLTSPRRLPELCAILTEARVAVTPMGGALRFGGTMELTGLDPSINRRRAEGIIKAAPRYLPDFAEEDFRGVKIWSGLRPCSPDGLPYLGRVKRFSNLTVATGHAMLGVSLAPITGRLVSDVLSGEPPSIPLELMSPERFGTD
jgi:D-amino-acid dehydrogenase